MAEARRGSGGTVLVCLLLGAAASGCGKHEGAGRAVGKARPASVVAQRVETQSQSAAYLAAQAGAEKPSEQILFGDLHVHTTFSADAFLMSLPIMQGEGAHPVGDACDFARYCSELDFWSINDHAEALTPRRWRETKDAIRQCNALAGDPKSPDMVAYIGWEWTQIGRTPKEHYGHKNVIFRDLGDDQVPRRPIHSASFTTHAMRQKPPLYVRLAPVVLDWPNRQRYLDLLTFQKELTAVPDCPEGVDTRKLPDECLEGAPTPQVLFEKLAQWGFDTMVIPHGTTWGIYTPQGASWDKQLTATQHDPEKQRLIEVYSGHGNSEEYRDWRAATFDAQGEPVCPAPSEGYEPCCWRAGEIIRSRCDDAKSPDCERRVQEARKNYLAAGVSGFLTVPGAQVEDWLDCGSCPDCFLPSMNYRPGNSVQYILSLSNFDQPGDPLRFQFGFIASSDNHRARPGTGYKEYGRLYNTESFGPRDEAWYRRMYPYHSAAPAPESVPIDQANSGLQGYQLVDFERQASFFMTGGLVAVHSSGRSREAIWDALKSRNVYGTSGPRILLWFDLLNGPQGELSMGGKADLAANPRFRVRAAGAFKQKAGCPDFATAGLPAQRLEQLCHGECYNPSDERLQISRIEVVRIRPQQHPGEPVRQLIEDPWRVIQCPKSPDGCVAEFEDDDFLSGGRAAVYYVRAIQEATPAINAGALRCKRDESGACVEVHPCYGDYRTSKDDDCLSPAEERAWSSPLYLHPAG